MILRPTLLAVLTVPLACRSVAPTPGESERLAVWMTGSFSSAAQAAEQPDAFYDIRLVMVPIWGERTDGPWLYVEQAAASALERPYRQRVYRLVDTAGGVRSDVFLLPGEPLDFAGAWREPARLDAVAPEQLEPRTGCSIHLSAVGDAYEGATRGTGCASSLGEASYATSEVRVEFDRLTSWDRGWTADGEQAWGAELGPYVFVRVPSSTGRSGAGD